MSFFLRPTVLLSFVCAIASTLSAEAGEVSEWYAQDAREAGGKLTLADRKGSADFEVADANGVSIGPKPSGGLDGKSLEFSGAQVSVLRTVQPFREPGEKVTIEALVRIGESGEAEEYTLFRYGTTWEVRYSRKTAMLSLVVWYDSNVFSTVSQRATPGDWQKLKAEFDAKTLMISVDGHSATAVPKDLIRRESQPAHLVFGASATRPVDGVMQRPFAGAVAELRITNE